MPWVKPAKDAVKVVYVYATSMGFRYTCRDEDGKVIYEGPQPYRSRYDARKAVKSSWPEAKVSFEA